MFQMNQAISIVFAFDPQLKTIVYHLYECETQEQIKTMSNVATPSAAMTHCAHARRMTKAMMNAHESN